MSASGSNPTKPLPARVSSIRFDRNEFAGAFGDIGTDLPLVIGMILAAGLNSAGVLAIFGVMQIFSGWMYRLPMPVQPLKAVAVLVIAQSASQKISPEILYGGGLAIGLTMLLLSITGLIHWLARVIPKVVVRGIQFGLGLQLTTLALKDYVQREGIEGYWLAGIAFVICLALYGNRKYPAAIFVLLLGAGYAMFRFKFDLYAATQQIGFSVPPVRTLEWQHIAAGFLLLALPQVPLSIGNSILAARQTSQDLFPDRAPSLRKISFTYSFMNLVNPFFGGIPTCHGSGGMAGHYAFGARTGGSVIIYGTLFLTLGIFFANGFENMIQIFPMPILGVILLFEGLALMLLIRDTSHSKSDFFLVLLVGLMASGLPYGYLIAMLVGTILARYLRK